MRQQLSGSLNGELVKIEVSKAKIISLLSRIFWTAILTRTKWWPWLKFWYGYITKPILCRRIHYILYFLIFNLWCRYKDIHSQLKFAKKLFNLTGFCSHIFDCILHGFLIKIFLPKLPTATVPKKVMYFCLPFTGSHSPNSHANQLSSQSCVSHLNVRLVFGSSSRLSSLLSFKEKSLRTLHNYPSYLFNSRCCLASYVGQTIRYLHTKISIVNLWDCFQQKENNHLVSWCQEYFPT